MTDYQYLKLNIQDRVGTVTIDRPPVNALSRPLLEELSAMLDELGNDPAVKVLVIASAAAKVFVAGADIKVFAGVEQQPEALAAVEAYIKLGQDVFTKLATLGIPTIAAINGACLGGGLELVLACDIRYAAETATLGAPEINLGLIPGWGGTQRLPRIVGQGHAIAMILTGEPVSATQAQAIGLVNRVVAPAELLNAAQALAGTIAAKSRIAISAALSAIRGGTGVQMEQGLTLERQQFATTVTSADAREGLAAFLEKRKPVFLDK